MALFSKLCSVCADKCTVPFSPLSPCMAPLHPLPLSLSVHLPSPPLLSLSLVFPHSSVLSLHLPPLLSTHVLQLFQLLQDTWRLEGGFLHVHLLSQSSILSVFQPTPKKVYIYLHLASSSSQPTQLQTSSSVKIFY